MVEKYPYSTRSGQPEPAPDPQRDTQPTQDHMAKTKKVASRLAKTEQKKIFQQTLLIIGAAIAVVIIFLFVILPAVIRLAVNLSEGTIGFEEQDTVPPQTPIVSAPPQATTESLVTISGFGEAGSTVRLVVNGAQAEQTTVDEEGAFAIDVGLEPGENTVTAYSIDPAENESGLSPEFTIISDNQAPEIVLTSPEDGQEFVSKQNQSITVEGTTEPDAFVFINGRRYRADEEGAFSASVRLSEGDNELQLRAEDQAGNETELTLTVSFKE